jgi:protein TonB
MNFSKKNHDIVRQNDKKAIKSQKHDANLQKNSTLYFQVGLILTLLAVYGLFEMNFETKSFFIEEPIEIVDDLYVFNDRIKVYEETSKTVEKKKRKPIIFINPIIKDNDDPIIETKGVITEPRTNDIPPIKPSDVPPVIDVEIPVSILAVEQVPIYPGCESATTNKARRDCMQEKLTKLISRKFDKDLASDLGLTGKQRISVQFKIDKFGNVTNIKAIAKHSRLIKEAKRVISKVPKMIPGKQKDKTVGVIYQIPILLMVED